jgi:hypothetical protein
VTAISTVAPDRQQVAADPDGHPSEQVAQMLAAVVRPRTLRP